MIQRISVPVRVSCTFDSKLRKVFPEVIVWEGRSYSIKKIGLHHTYRLGKTLYHVFSVESPTLFFRLVLNTDKWKNALSQIASFTP